MQIYNTPIDSVTNKLEGAYAFFVQDAWTLGRVTLNGGIRFDRMQQAIPAQTSAAGTWVPARSFATIPLPTYTDWSPRIGAAWDVFATRGRRSKHRLLGKPDAHQRGSERLAGSCRPTAGAAMAKIADPPLIASMSARATSGRTAGQPWLRPRRPLSAAIRSFT